LALGQQLVVAKCGNEQIRNQIATLDEKLRILKEGKGSTIAPKAERDRLIMALSEAALARPTAPAGLEASYHMAKDAQTRLLEQKARSNHAGTHLFPKDSRAWKRVVLGYSALACLVVLSAVGLAQLGRNVGQAHPSNNQSVADAKKTKADHAGDALTDPPTSKEVATEVRLPEKGSLKDAQPSGTSVVFAEGIGTTEKEALMDAFRTAVQRVVGVFVDSETLVKNDAIISDNVLTFSDGAIKKYEELEHSENKGLFRVKLKAAVERRTVAARLEAAHISMKVVDIKNIAEAFSKEISKEIRADLDRLANEITEREARDNAWKLLDSDLTRIAKINMIEAKVVGELERGTRVGTKLPLTIRVRYEVNKAAFDEAMTKLEKSLLMNSSRWGKITFLATPDLIMKRANQNSINEEIGLREFFVLVNKGLASEKWRSHWHYYVLSYDLGLMVHERLVEKKPPNVKLSLLDKDGQVVAVDEFTSDHIVRAFRWRSGAKEYATQPLNRGCYYLSPFFFSSSPDIRYMMAFEQVREIPLTVDEINLIQSVKCELFP